MTEASLTSVLPVFEGLDTVTGCDTAADARFVAWCIENGVKFPKLEYPFFDKVNGMRGVGAKADIYPGETLIEVPEKLMITAPRVYDDPEIGHVFAQCRELFEMDEDVILAVYLSYHALAGKASRWSPWFDVIPRCIESTANWTDGQLSELQDSQFRSIARERDEQLRQTCENITSTLRARFPGHFGEDFTPEVVRWALQTVAARAYGRRLPDAALVPMADVFNHANVAVKYELASGSSTFDRPPVAPVAPSSAVTDGPGTADTAPNALCGGSFAASMGSSSDEKSCGDSSKDEQLRNKAPEQQFFRLWNSGLHTYKAGEEVHNSYGRRDNKHLALEYGFVIADNHWESVECRPGGVMDIAPPPVMTIPSKIRAILLRQGLMLPHFVLHWNVWCAAALPYFRALSLDPSECIAVENSPTIALTRCISMTNEVAALTLLRNYYKSALTYAATTIEEDETLLKAPSSYRHLVALTYRITRKRILAQQIQWIEALTLYIKAEQDRIRRIDSTAVPSAGCKHAAMDYLQSVVRQGDFEIVRNVAMETACSGSTVKRPFVAKLPGDADGIVAAVEEWIKATKPSSTPSTKTKRSDKKRG